MNIWGSKRHQYEEEKRVGWADSGYKGQSDYRLIERTYIPLIKNKGFDHVMFIIDKTVYFSSVFRIVWMIV